MSRTEQFIGLTRTGEKVYVTAEITRQSGKHTTIEHKRVAAVDQVSISGTVVCKGGSITRSGDQVGFGQVLEDLRAVVEPADGWTRADIRTLANAWDRWHLNDMRGACAHMPADAHKRWDRRETVRCTEGTGYSYGSAWLVEAPPADVVRFIRAKFKG